MTQPLDQSDLDALRDSVRDLPGAGRGSAPFIFSRTRRDFENVEIREYDFKRPERISKEQMRALQTLHENFGRSLGASLSGFLRTIVEIRVVQVEQVTYGEFIASLPNPTSFNLIDVEGLDGQLCLEFSPLVVYPMIDRLLGGANHEQFIPQREMTVIEIRIIKTILRRATVALAEAWEGVRELEFSVGEMESNPQIVQIVPPNEVAVVLGFEIKMSDRAGTMSLCIPYKTIEPVIDELAAQSWTARGRARRDERWRGVIAERLSDARLDVTGVLARTTITMSELRSLEPGDLLLTGRPARSPTVIEVAGRPKFLANIGQSRGNRAMRIIRPLEPAERGLRAET